MDCRHKGAFLGLPPRPYENPEGKRIPYLAEPQVIVERLHTDHPVQKLDVGCCCKQRMIHLLPPHFDVRLFFSKTIVGCSKTSFLRHDHIEI